MAHAEASFVICKSVQQAEDFCMLLTAGHFLDTPIMCTSTPQAAATSTGEAPAEGYGWTDGQATDDMPLLRTAVLGIDRHGDSRRLTVVVAAVPGALQPTTAQQLLGAAAATAIAPTLPGSAGGATDLPLCVCSVFFTGPCPLPGDGQARDGDTGRGLGLADVRVTPGVGGKRDTIPDAGPVPILASMAADPSERWQWRRLLLNFTARSISCLHPGWREEHPTVFVQPTPDVGAGGDSLSTWADAAQGVLGSTWPPEVYARGEDGDDCVTLADRVALVAGYVPAGEVTPDGPSPAVDGAWRSAYGATTAAAAVMWVLQGNQGLWGAAGEGPLFSADDVFSTQRRQCKEGLKVHRDALWGLDTGNGGVVEDEASEVVARRQESTYDLLGGWVGILAILSTLASFAFFFAMPAPQQ